MASICVGKRVKPNKCKKLNGCKVAKGTKKTFCRKAKNKTAKRGGKTCTSKRNKQQRNQTRKNKK